MPAGPFWEGFTPGESFSSPLTAWTEVRSPSAQGDARNDLSATRAGKAGALINPQLVLKSPLLTVKIPPVGNAGSAAGNGFVQNRSDGGRQSGPCGHVERTGRPCGIDPGLVQDFTGVYIADAGNNGLVEKKGFNRALAV